MWYGVVRIRATYCAVVTAPIATNSPARASWPRAITTASPAVASASPNGVKYQPTRTQFCAARRGYSRQEGHVVEVARRAIAGRTKYAYALAATTIAASDVRASRASRSRRARAAATRHA